MLYYSHILQNGIYLADFPEEELLNMIDHAYDTVLSSFCKKVQKEIQQEIST